MPHQSEASLTPFCENKKMGALFFFPELFFTSVASALQKKKQNKLFDLRDGDLSTQFTPLPKAEDSTGGPFFFEVRVFFSPASQKNFSRLHFSDQIAEGG